MVRSAAGGDWGCCGRPNGRRTRPARWLRSASARPAAKLAARAVGDRSARRARPAALGMSLARGGLGEPRGGARWRCSRRRSRSSSTALARLELAHALADLGRELAARGRRREGRDPSAGRSSWPTSAVRWRWPNGPRAELQAGPGRRARIGADRVAAHDRRGVAGLPPGGGGTTPTARSPRPCSSPRRRSSATCPARIRSWGSAPASSSPPRSATSGVTRASALAKTVGKTRGVPLLCGARAAEHALTITPITDVGTRRLTERKGWT